jgi:hypothetical protein
MWKYLAAIVLLVGITVYVSVQDERAAQSGTSASANLDKGAPPARNDTDQSKGNVSNAEGNSSSWYGFFRWPNGTTVWAIILTLWAIAEQTSETRRAARASEQSVNAIVNSERSWILTRIVLEGLGQVTNSGLDAENTYVNIVFKCRNDGRTPAWITNHRIWCRMTEDLPVIPDTSITPSFSRIGPRPISIGRKINVKTTLECEGHRTGIGGRALVIYAVVNYRDVFGEHETWCGYNLMGSPQAPRLERLVGDNKYNQYT